MFPGDPALPGSASELQAGNTPGERIGVASYGPIRLLPGTVNELIVAFFYSYEAGRSPQEQASRLIQQAKEIQDAFDNCFEGVPTDCNYVLSASSSPASRKDALTVFPSPANATLNIRSDAGPLRALSLSDALGRTVVETSVGGHATQARLDTGSRPAGIYYLRATFVDGSISTVPVSVQR